MKVKEGETNVKRRRAMDEGKELYFVYRTCMFVGRWVGGLEGVGVGESVGGEA